jgi:hypothetical protein
MARLKRDTHYGLKEQMRVRTVFSIQINVSGDATTAKLRIRYIAGAASLAGPPIALNAFAHVLIVKEILLKHSCLVILMHKSIHNSSVAGRKCASQPAHNTPDGCRARPTTGGFSY